MAESVVRVQRQAGEFATRLRGMRQDVGELIQQLDRVNPAMAASVRRIDEWREQVRQGGRGAGGGPDVSAAYEQLNRQSGTLPPELQRAVQGYVTGRAGTLPPPPSAPQAKPPGSPEQELERQRELLRQRGFSEADVARAKVLRPGDADHPGTVLIPPVPPRPAPGGEDVAPPPPGEPRAPDPVPREPRFGERDFPGQYRPQPSRAPQVRRDSEEVTDATQRETAATLRNAEAKRIAGLSDRQLRYEFTATQRELRAHEREMDKLYRAEELLGTKRQVMRKADIDEQRESLQASAAITRERTRLQIDEIERRGGKPVGDYVEGLGARVGGAAGPFQRGAGAFLAGAGLGGGGVFGSLLGGALGTMGWGTALPLAAGYAVGAVVNRGSEAYGSYMGRLRSMERIARVTQQTSGNIREDVQVTGRGLKVFSEDDLLAAQEATARGTGLRQTPGSTLELGSVTGQSAAEAAQQFVAFSSAAPNTRAGRDARIFAEFAASSGAGRQKPAVTMDLSEAQRRNNAGRARLLAGGLPGSEGGPLDVLRRNRTVASGGIPAEWVMPEETERKTEVRGQPLSTALYPTFVEQMMRMIGSQGMSPLTRTEPEGVAAQLRAASTTPMAGIEMVGPDGQPSKQGLEVGGALVGGINAALGGVGGGLGDANVLGVMRLRGTPTAARLKREFGIDLDTISGMRRAMKRAPELAQKKIPQVAEAMYGAQRQVYGDADFYETVLAGQGVDEEVAAKMANEPGEVGRILRPGRAKSPDLSKMAAGIAGTPDVEKLWEKFLRPEFDEQVLGAAIAEKLGPIITKGWNDMGQQINSAISTILADTINNPPEAP